jgi:hypothetical protein
MCGCAEGLRRPRQLTAAQVESALNHGIELGMFLSRVVCVWLFVLGSIAQCVTVLQANGYLRSDIFSVNQDGSTSSFDHSALSAAADRVFIPVVAMLNQSEDQDASLSQLAAEEKEAEMTDDASDSTSGAVVLRAPLQESRVMFDVSDMNKILSEERRTLMASFADVQRVYGAASADALITAADVQFVVACQHMLVEEIVPSRAELS